MATFKYLILPHHLKEDGTYNVKIRVTQRGKSKYIKTNYYVSSADITKKKGEGKEKIKIKNQAIIDLMEELIIGYKKKLNAEGLKVDLWDVDRIVDFLTKDDNHFKLNFIDYGRKIADELQRDGRLGTAKNYRIAINALIRFLGNDDLDINNITASFMIAFEKFLKSEPSYRGCRDGGSAPTDKAKGQRVVSLYTYQIKTLHNLAKNEFNDEDRGIINIPFSPFSKYKIAPAPKAEHRTLSIEQVQQIIDLPYKTNGRCADTSVFNLAKDMFILSFALMGINSADLYNAAMIDGDIITYQRTKTKSRREDHAEMKVRIEPVIRKLFEKYRDPSGERVFYFHDRYKDSLTFNKSINLGMHQVGELIGTPKLNYYYARHSMATIAANKAGIDIARVDEMLNHSDYSLKLARVYIERDYSVIWEANKKLLSLFRWDSIS